MRKVRSILYDGSLVHKVGQKGVVSIEHHYPCGEGDRHYCEVYFADGSKNIIYKLDIVSFDPPDEN